jgi:tripartite-type tricarboxylate transporter receptor subunit TctC
LFLAFRRCAVHRFWTTTLCLLAFSIEARAQADWPNRPIKIIVSQAAGAAPDIVCRYLADWLSNCLGQQFIIENRPGGQNTIGAQAAARSPADGYNFFFATTAALATNPHTFKSLPYDPLRDFTPVSMIAKGPFFLMAHPSVPGSTLKEAIAADKADPGKLAIATEGPRQFTGILAGWLNKKAGTKFYEVPYASVQAGMQDALAGRVQLISSAIAPAKGFIASGQLKALAISSPTVFPNFPDIRPIAETVPGVSLVGWFVLVAPAGTPEPVVTRVNQEMAKVLARPEVRRRLLDMGVYTEGAGSIQETGKFIQDEYALWQQALRDIGLEPQ